MTDNDIIKALECCLKGDYDKIINALCAKCPYCKNTDCKLILQQDVLDLINRQKAEIERLQKIILGFMDEVGTWSNKYDVDISNIHKLPLLAKEDFNIKNKIKSEAIKEFAELCKKCFPSIACVFDILIKEMAEREADNG